METMKTKQQNNKGIKPELLTISKDELNAMSYVERRAIKTKIELTNALRMTKYYFFYDNNDQKRNLPKYICSMILAFLLTFIITVSIIFDMVFTGAISTKKDSVLQYTLQSLTGVKTLQHGQQKNDKHTIAFIKRITKDLDTNNLSLFDHIIIVKRIWSNYSGNGVLGMAGILSFFFGLLAFIRMKICFNSAFYTACFYTSLTMLGASLIEPALSIALVIFGMAVDMAFIDIRTQEWGLDGVRA